MDPGLDVTQRLHAQEVSHAELADIVSAHFNSASQPTDAEVHYPGHDVDFALKFVYDRRRLRQVVTGPALTEDTLKAIQAQIENELLALPMPRVRTQILFATVPVEGSFLYEDRFQITPVPPNAARPRFLMGAHPFVLEVRYEATPNGFLNNQRFSHKAEQLELLLVGLIPNVIGSLPNDGRHHWTIRRAADHTDFTTEYLQQGYVARELPGEGTSFAPAGAALPLVQTLEYYSRLGIRPGQQLDLPQDFGTLLAAFFALDEENRDRFLRSCYWLRQSQRSRADSRSAAFTAVISAIEALMPPEPRSETCDACGQRTGPGATQRFAEFVDAFAPQGTGREDRKTFYRLRSKLSHGGALLFSDHQHWWSLVPEQSAEWTTSSAASRIAQVVLINWLAAALR